MDRETEILKTGRHNSQQNTIVSVRTCNESVQRAQENAWNGVSVWTTRSTFHMTAMFGCSMPKIVAIFLRGALGR